MVNPWWSWTLTAVSFINLVLLSTGKSWPWLMASVGQTAWIVYGAATHQWGFVASGCLFAATNLWCWRKARMRQARELAGVS